MFVFRLGRGGGWDWLRYYVGQAFGIYVTRLMTWREDKTSCIFGSYLIIPCLLHPSMDPSIHPTSAKIKQIKRCLWFFTSRHSFLISAAGWSSESRTCLTTSNMNIYMIYFASPPFKNLPPPLTNISVSLFSESIHSFNCVSCIFSGLLIFLIFFPYLLHFPVLVISLYSLYSLHSPSQCSLSS